MCHVPDNMVDGVVIFSSSYEKPPPGLIKVSVKFVRLVILLGVLDLVLRLSHLLRQQLPVVLNLLHDGPVSSLQMPVTHFGLSLEPGPL